MSRIIKGSFIRIIKKCIIFSMNGIIDDIELSEGEVHQVISVRNSNSGSYPIIQIRNEHYSFSLKNATSFSSIFEDDIIYFDLLSDSMFDQQYIAQKFFKDNDKILDDQEHSNLF